MNEHGLAGQQIGRVVELVDDRERSGGYEVFTYADMNRSPETFDNWLQCFADLERFFSLRGWEIDWADSP